MGAQLGLGLLAALMIAPTSALVLGWSSDGYEPVLETIGDALGLAALPWWAGLFARRLRDLDWWPQLALLPASAVAVLQIASITERFGGPSNVYMLDGLGWPLFGTVISGGFVFLACGALPGAVTRGDRRIDGAASGAT